MPVKMVLSQIVKNKTLMQTFAVCLLALLAAACVPIPLPVEVCSHLPGKVIDGNTQKPVSGARILVVEFPKHIIWSSSEGEFDVPKVTEWHLLKFGGDYMSESCTIIVSAPGYKPFYMQPSFGNTRYRLISLERMPD
jgi:hypothetical protein